MITSFNSNEWIYQFNGPLTVTTTILFEKGSKIEIYDEQGEVVKERNYTASVVEGFYKIDMKKEGFFTVIKFIASPLSKDQITKPKPKEIETLMDGLSKHASSLRARGFAQGLVTRPVNKNISTSSVVQPDYDRASTFKGGETGVGLPFIEGNEGVIGDVVDNISTIELNKGPVVVTGFLENFTNLSSFNSADNTQKVFLLRKAYNTDKKAIRREVTGLKKKNLGLYQTENLEKFRVTQRYFYNYERVPEAPFPVNPDIFRYSFFYSLGIGDRTPTLDESLTGSYSSSFYSVLKGVTTLVSGVTKIFYTTKGVATSTSALRDLPSPTQMFVGYYTGFTWRPFGSSLTRVGYSVSGNGQWRDPLVNYNSSLIKQDLKTILFGTPDAESIPYLDFFRDSENAFFGLAKAVSGGGVKTAFTFYDKENFDLEDGHLKNYNEQRYTDADLLKRPYNTTTNDDPHLKGIYPSYDNSYTLTQNNISLTYPTGITGKLWYVAIPKDQVVNEVSTVVDHFEKEIVGFRLYDGWKYQLDLDVRVGSLRYKKTLLATNQTSTGPNTSSDVITANVYEDQDFIYFVGVGTPPSSFNFNVVKDMTAIPLQFRFQWEGKKVLNSGLTDFTYPRASTFNNFYDRLPTTFIPKI